MCRVLNIILGLLSRILYALHGFIMVWCVWCVKSEKTYWLLLTGVLLLSVEMAITIKCTRNATWKRFSPAVFLYLITVIPSIWYLELELLKTRESSAKIKPTPTPTPKPTQVPFHRQIYEGKISAELVDVLEQTMFIVLILGRWLMPKGDLSHDQLSQLLTVYVSLGADILDVSDTFKKSNLNTNRDLIIVGLSLFTYALMKFPFPPKKLYRKSTRPKKSRCFEIWRLLITDGIQDSSFLVYRLYLISNEKDQKGSERIFFMCKNIIMVILVLYKIFMVYFGHRCKGREKSSEHTESV